MDNTKIQNLLEDQKLFNADQVYDIELLETKIYRYFRLNDLIESLSTKKLRLKKPHLWDDPFENLFLKSKVVNAKGQPADLSTTREQIFAQCWTFKEESDLMWSSYIHDSKGAKVTVSLKDILKVISRYQFAFIAKINYWTEQEILDYFSKPLSLDVSNKENPFIKTLCIKRKEFEEEQEVRIIFPDMFRNRDLKSRIHVANFNINDYKSDYTYFEFDPDQLFSEIVLHPKMKVEKAEQYKYKLSQLYAGKIYKSKLYETPDILIQIDNDAT